MTLDEFLLKLSETDRDWHVLRRRGAIRSNVTCPICAVAGRVGCDYFRVGIEMGLGVRLMNNIALAADYHIAELTELAELRRRLLNACGLKEETAA